MLDDDNIAFGAGNEAWHLMEIVSNFLILQKLIESFRICHSSIYFMFHLNVSMSITREIKMICRNSVG